MDKDELMGEADAPVDPDDMEDWEWTIASEREGSFPCILCDWTYHTEHFRVAPTEKKYFWNHNNRIASRRCRRCREVPPCGSCLLQNQDHKLSLGAEGCLACKSAVQDYWNHRDVEGNHDPQPAGGDLASVDPRPALAKRRRSNEEEAIQEEQHDGAMKKPKRHRIAQQVPDDTIQPQAQSIDASTGPNASDNVADDSDDSLAKNAQNTEDLDVSQVRTPSHTPSPPPAAPKPPTPQESAAPSVDPPLRSERDSASQQQKPREDWVGSNTAIEPENTNNPTIVQQPAPRPPRPQPVVPMGYPTQQFAAQPRYYLAQPGPTPGTMYHPPPQQQQQQPFQQAAAPAYTDYIAFLALWAQQHNIPLTNLVPSPSILNPPPQPNYITPPVPQTSTERPVKTKRKTPAVAKKSTAPPKPTQSANVGTSSKDKASSSHVDPITVPLQSAPFKPVAPPRPKLETLGSAVQAVFSSFLRPKPVPTVTVPEPDRMAIDQEEVAPSNPNLQSFVFSDVSKAPSTSTPQSPKAGHVGNKEIYPPFGAPAPSSDTFSIPATSTEDKRKSKGKQREEMPSGLAEVTSGTAEVQPAIIRAESSGKPPAQIGTQTDAGGGTSGSPPPPQGDAIDQILENLMASQSRMSSLEGSVRSLEERYHNLMRR